MLLLIDNYDSFTYNLMQIASQYYKEVKVIRNDVMGVKDIEKLNPRGILISPGPKGPKQAGVCIELIQHVCDRIPILGICLGMQAIAASFGAEVKRTQEPRHGKASEIFHSGQEIFAGLPSPFAAGRYHSLAVVENTLPTMLEVKAKTSDGIIMAIKHREFPCYGVQFHPESILTPLGPQIIKNFIGVFLCKEFP